MASARGQLQLAGVPAFLRVLEELGGNIATRIAKEATEQGGEVVKRAAQANLLANPSVESTALVDSITNAPRYYRRTKTAVAIVGPRFSMVRHYRNRLRRPFKYAHLVEGGTAPHFTGKGARRFTRKVKRIDQRGNVRIEKYGAREFGTIHPGSRPEPFMRPAFDANRRTVLAIAERIARQRLDREARRLAAKQFREAAREATMISIPQPVRIARTGAVGYRVAGGGAALGVASMSTFDREFRREAALAARAAGGRLPRRR